MLRYYSSVIIKSVRVLNARAEDDYFMMQANVSVLEELRSLKQELQDSL